ncbi:unnamed protein product [Rotaria sp. Silwood1]|nr:unnamed protein product [Rotaria sp. Silwood1]CAF5141240.1 unnamed protein product [Rotaria sp. Silwood1]
MDWIKNENGSIDIVYFQNSFIIQTEQYFDNENFYIQFKTNENDQSFQQISVNNYVNQHDGSLKCVDKFIAQTKSHIDEFSR